MNVDDYKNIDTMKKIVNAAYLLIREENDIVCNNTGAHSSFSFLICDFTVINFSQNHTSLSFLEVILNRVN